MMPTLIETLERGHGPHCSREEAARLLEGLRAAYQSLSQFERRVVKGVIWQQERAQVVQEMDQEIECFE
jgi:FixJ family two-component response regulator